MDRRRFLAALGIAAGAGCLDGREPADGTWTTTARPTLPANVTVVDETRPLPAPPESPTLGPARSFVATYEEHLVHNELVGDGGMVSVERHRPPTSVDVEPATVRLLRETAGGYVFVSECTGSAEYYCEGRCSSSSTRNAHDVVHFVGPGVHTRVPFNAYSCERPGPAEAGGGEGDDAGGGDEGDDDRPTARFQIYDLESDIDYGEPERGGQDVAVRVTDRTGGVLLDRTYRTSLPLSIQTDVVAEPGRYELAATLEDGTRAVHEWDLSEPGTPPWWALSVFVTPSGEPFARVVSLPGGLGPPRHSLCHRM